MYHDSNILENANSTPSDPAIKAITTPPLKNNKCQTNKLHNTLLAGRLLQFIMASQSHHQNHNESKAKNKHRPINKSGKCRRIIGSHSWAAPFSKPPAPQQAHQGCAKHATIPHTSQHPAYDNSPEGSRCYRLCTHVKPPFKVIYNQAVIAMNAKTLNKSNT